MSSNEQYSLRQMWEEIMTDGPKKAFHAFLIIGGYALCVKFMEWSEHRFFLALLILAVVAFIGYQLHRITPDESTSRR